MRVDQHAREWGGEEETERGRGGLRQCHLLLSAVGPGAEAEGGGMSAIFGEVALTPETTGLLRG